MLYFENWLKTVTREIKTRKISDRIPRQERVQSYVDSQCCKITNAWSWAELHRKYNAKYTGGESSSACTYISDIPRHRETMQWCAVAVVSRISLAFSHVTFDHRRVNAFSEQYIAPNDISRLRSFFLLVTTLSRCNFMHFIGYAWPSLRESGKRDLFFRCFYS